MSPEEIELRRKILLDLMSEEAPLLARVANAIPDDKLRWKPDTAKAMTACELVYHASAATGFFLELARGEEPSIPPMPKFRTTGELLAMVGVTQETYVNAIAQMTTEELGTERSFFGTDHAAIDILGWHIRHMIHHRGQVVLYLRLMGARVPSTYGASGDEAPAAGT
jgi:uncharacterized damage-inducible protein DinB